MDQLVDFFLAPYRNASLFDILLEVFAATTGVMSVFYAKKENILVYPVGIISTAIYVFICYKFVLYGDLLINIYYTLMSLYGWYMWSRMVGDKQLQITTSNNLDWIKTSVIFIITAIFVIVVYSYYGVINYHLGLTKTIELIGSKIKSGDIRDITPYLDTFTTGMFFAAMWQMANKKIENWILWTLGNIVSIPLYFVKGLGFTGIQFTIFLIIAILGYIEWKKTLDKSLQTL